MLCVTDNSFLFVIGPSGSRTESTHNKSHQQLYRTVFSVLTPLVQFLIHSLRSNFAETIRYFTSLDKHPQLILSV